MRLISSITNTQATQIQSTETLAAFWRILPQKCYGNCKISKELEYFCLLGLRVNVSDVWWKQICRSQMKTRHAARWGDQRTTRPRPQTTTFNPWRPPSPSCLSSSFCLQPTPPHPLTKLRFTKPSSLPPFNSLLKIHSTCSGNTAADRKYTQSTFCT